MLDFAYLFAYRSGDIVNQYATQGMLMVYSELCEQALGEAFELMCLPARQRNADAIIALHYDATELMPGWPRCCAM